MGVPPRGMYDLGLTVVSTACMDGPQMTRLSDGEGARDYPGWIFPGFGSAMVDVDIPYQGYILTPTPSCSLYRIYRLSHS
jgi:hypothetical protein